LEFIVIIAAIAIISAIAVPKFFDFDERANEELLDAKISELTVEILNQQEWKRFSAIKL
jgi:hypothetical protein